MSARAWPASALIAVVSVAACGSTTPRHQIDAHAGSPNTLALRALAGLSSRQRATFRAGEVVVGQSGCLACHVIDRYGNNGPGPPLTHEGSHLSTAAITSALTHPRAPMPSFAGLAHQYPEKFKQLVNLISMLH